MQSTLQRSSFSFTVLVGSCTCSQSWSLTTCSASCTGARLHKCNSVGFGRFLKSKLSLATFPNGRRCTCTTVRAWLVQPGQPVGQQWWKPTECRCDVQPLTKQPRYSFTCVFYYLQCHHDEDNISVEEHIEFSYD